MRRYQTRAKLQKILGMSDTFLRFSAGAVSVEACFGQIGRHGIPARGWPEVGLLSAREHVFLTSFCGVDRVGTGSGGVRADGENVGENSAVK